MVYNPRKAAQVISFFASKSDDNHIEILKVIKLVYLADRESLKTYGFPVLDEQRVSMPHGPVNSLTYSFINGEMENAGWSEFLLDRDNHRVSVKPGAPQDWDELSEADLECLEMVWKQFGQMNKWEIRDWTHSSENIPEWEDPGRSSSPIPIERILLSVGIHSHVQAAEQIHDLQKAERLISSLGQ